MKVSEFDFYLPPECIAQRPLPRGTSRLLTLDRYRGVREHGSIQDLPEKVFSGDVLVLNDTRVIPARLFGLDETGRRTEFLLVTRVSSSEKEAIWDCLAKPGRRAKAGRRFDLGGGVRGSVLEKIDSGQYRVAFSGDAVGDELLRLGTPPLPPYIHRPEGMADERDRQDYQTVFAKEEGAIAAPTAGLHLTEALLQALRDRGVQIVFLTLHVGLGTFKPVKVEDVSEHRMDFESGEIRESAARVLGDALKEGRRIIAVGTTSVRSLESAIREGEGVIRPGVFRTNLFITPGFEFRAVGALLTNFHLPKSTLLMLVSAFAGKEKVLAAYEEAVRMGYRFFSYGDAMWVS